MSEKPYVFEGDSGNFEARVLQRSHEIPVMVDFWAAWCGPCRMLAPVIEGLAAEYDGGFELVKVDTDAHGELAARYGVRGLPTLKIFRGGKIVGELVGVQSETAIRAVLDPHLVTDADRLVQEATQLGPGPNSLELLRRAQELDPDKPAILLALAEAEARAGNANAARDALGACPANVRMDPVAKRTDARLRLLDVLDGAPEVATLEQELARDPDLHRARYQLAARHALAGKYADALTGLGEIMNRERGWHDGEAHQGLLAVLELLDEDDPLAGEWRKRLAAMLY